MQISSFYPSNMLTYIDERKDTHVSVCNSTHRLSQNVFNFSPTSLNHPRIHLMHLLLLE
eukprot:m.1658805 g.1658805  ORF g.1658805 m.1658805 type:complete len:59 (-) comp117251_c0_seq1:34-210(-)